MDEIHSFVHCAFKELSNDTSHAQILVKMKKLWLQQVGEEKQIPKQKLCRDRVHFVATKSQCRLCLDKILLCCDKLHFVATKVIVQTLT